MEDSRLNLDGVPRTAPVWHDTPQHTASRAHRAVGEQVDVQVGRGAFEALRTEWDALVAEHPAPPFSMRYAWYAAYLHDLHPVDASDVISLVFRRRGHCRGILCLIPEMRARLGLTAAVLMAPSSSELMANSCVLGVGETLEAWWQPACDALRRAGVAWQAMCLPRLVEDANLEAISGGLGMRRVFRVQDQSRFLDGACGYDAVRRGYSSRLRKILTKGWSRLRRTGEVGFRVVTDPREREAAFEEFLRLESSGWKGADGCRTSLNDNPPARAFYRDLFTGSTALAPAEISLLTVDGQPVAAQLCMRSGGTRSILKIAFDQARANASPGSVLLDALLRDGCESGEIAVVDLITNAPWMDEWGARAVPVGDLWLFRSGVTGAAASLLLTMFSTS